MVGHGHGIPLEVVASMLEVADLAWSAVEHRRERKVEAAEEDDAAQLRAENVRLRSVLAENLALLQNVYKSPAFSADCPPDLHTRLVAAVENSKFLNKLETLQEDSKGVPISGAPITVTEGANPNCTEVLVDVEGGESSWWIWVTHDLTPDCIEEVSGIDNENYVVITEENVVDGISNFIARCILENPKSKNLTPEELEKAMRMTLGGIKDRRKWKDIWEAGKVIYTLSTWGIALAGLYRHRAIVKVAAKGVSTSAKLVMKVI